MEKTSVTEWRQGGLVVTVAVLGTTTVALHLNTLGPLMHLIQADTGWTRQQVVMGITVISLMSIGLLPIGGMLADKFGVRRVAAPGLVLYGAGFVALSFAGPNIASWIFGWVILALALSAIQTVWVTGVCGHFNASRGLAIAIAVSGSGVAAIATPYITVLLAQRYGWRGAYMRVALFPLVVTLPAVLAFFKDARFSRETVPKELPSAKPAAHAIPLLAGNSIVKIILSRHFWQMAAGGVLISSAGASIAIHLVPLIMDGGTSGKRAAAVAAMFGIGVIVGRVVGGILVDRFHAGRVGAVFAALAALGVAAMMTAPSSVKFLSMIVFSLGLATGTEVDCIAYLTGKYFGIRNFGFAFAALTGLFAIGAGTMPLAGGALYDVYKNYWIFQAALVGAFALGALALGLLGPYPRGDTSAR